MCAQRGAGVHFVDATPNYLSRPFVAPRIAAAYPPSLRPQLRLIAVLREPVSRGLSWYNHKLHGWTERDMGTTYEGINQTFCAGGGAEAPAPTSGFDAAADSPEKQPPADEEPAGESAVEEPAAEKDAAPEQPADGPAEDAAEEAAEEALSLIHI